MNPSSILPPHSSHFVGWAIGRPPGYRPEDTPVPGNREPPIRVPWDDGQEARPAGPERRFP